MKNMKTMLPWTAVVLGLFAPDLFGQEVAVEPTAGDVSHYAIDNLFLFLAAVLVLFMQAGFAMLESGLNSGKNAVNILTKNVVDVAAGILIFFAFGFAIMYPGSYVDALIAPSKFFGFGGFGIYGGTPDVAGGNLHPQVDFLFQAAFAATAATIVSGAVAGRMKFVGYLTYTVVLTGFIYPISGMWKWGGGFLDALGFYDFAGSIVVHALGGFAGLAAAIVLGPRIGRFGPGGKAMPGHNLTFAALGVFILFIGWFGFNPGSQLAIAGADNTNIVMMIAVNTALAAAAGSIFALITSWVVGKKPDLTMALNGLLAGLVGITANCDCVSNGEAVLIGAIAGVLVFGGIKLLEVLKIDDPVGAWPVHGLCGIWGGIATGIFGGHPLVAQITGSIVISAWAFGTMLGLFFIMKAMGILRVSEEEEMKGLDLTEHGQEAYAPVA